MKVFVYFNLHKHCFSVKALEGERKGKVVAHLDAVNLKDVTFKVSKAGRERVLREKRKNVHAGVVGSFVSWMETPDLGKLVRYNPYHTETFVDIVGKPVHNAKFARLSVRYEDNRPMIFVGG